MYEMVNSKPLFLFVCLIYGCKHITGKATNATDNTRNISVNNCLTTHNELCAFPFKYQGVSYDECILYSDANKNDSDSDHIDLKSSSRNSKQLPSLE